MEKTSWRGTGENHDFGAKPQTPDRLFVLRTPRPSRTFAFLGVLIQEKGETWDSKGKAHDCFFKMEHLRVPRVGLQGSHERLADVNVNFQTS